MKIEGGEQSSADKAEHMLQVLEECYRDAEKIVAGDKEESALIKILGEEAHKAIKELGRIGHAARGVALTLCAYKSIVPGQDIRAHKSEHAGGFSGRALDSRVTVPFLITKGLPRSVESHWLSQTFSFAGPYTKDSVLKTAPKTAGPLLIGAVNAVQEAKNSQQYAKAAVVVILEQMIRIRNQGQVVLTR